MPQVPLRTPPTPWYEKWFDRKQMPVVLATLVAAAFPVVWSEWKASVTFYEKSSQTYDYNYDRSEPNNVSHDARPYTGGWGNTTVDSSRR